MTEDSIPPLLLQTIITIPIFWYTKKGGPKGKLVMNEEYTRKEIYFEPEPPFLYGRGPHPPTLAAISPFFVTTQLANWLKL